MMLLQLVQEPILRTSGVNSETEKALKLPIMQANKLACWFYTHILTEDMKP